MASSNPPRKFAPTPIEQTTKSSRQPAAPQNEEKKPKRFSPEPVEETVKSSKDARQQAEKPKPRRFAPEPVEHTVKSSKDTSQVSSEQHEKPKPRRFAPEPVEITTKSSKHPHPEAEEQKEKPKARRFAPQVVEETHKSSKDKDTHDRKGHVKFSPDLVSTTHITKRNAKKLDDAYGDETEQQPPRKFTPILLDTATRSRRAGDPNAPLGPRDRTEYAYHLHASEHWKRVTGVPSSGPSSNAEPEPESTDDMDIDDEASESGRSAASDTNLSSQAKREVCIDGSAPSKRSSCLMPARTHSFRTPELDTIDSSESEPDSNPSPMSTSPGPDGSPITIPDYEFFKHATRIRESVDENFTHYLLEVERKKQQQRLEEQALAAFPNADFGYEPPDHYINNDDDSDMEIEDRPVTFDLDEEELLDVPRRESRTREMSWEQQEAQRHAEEAQRERNANKVTHKPTQSPFWKPPRPDDQDPEVMAMRDRARPPMLGADIVFPRCPSPEPARFDVTQGSTALRNQMCYLTEAAEAERKRTGEEEGLWHVRTNNKQISTIKSGAVGAAKKSSTHKGLWGGLCAADEDAPMKKAGLAPPTGPTGLQTPNNERINPFELAHIEGRQPGLQTPGTLAAGMKEGDLHHLDAVLVTEQDLDAMMQREFPDSFITQVYNYLSLGYPSLARPFDEELCKISRMPISELRQDDQKARLEPRGYIRLGSDFEGGGGEGMTEESCMRWRALKLYVREWARQEKNMVKTDGVFGNWGTGARRGSWAI